MTRFALLEHRWEGVHWDLMLETSPGEALRTFALEAELVERQEIPARELGPHRQIYLDYEGEVSGGRGTVRRVDRGWFVLEVNQASRIVIRLFGEHHDGRLILRALAGSKWVGEWVSLFGGPPEQ